MDGKSLTRRQNRGNVVMQLSRATMPGQMVLQCRRELEHAHKLSRATSDPQAFSTLSQSACRLRDQLMDLLQLPKRPAGGKPGDRAISVPATVVDAVLSPVDVDKG